MRNPTKLPNIPDIPPDVDHNVRVILEPVKQRMETREGLTGKDKLDANVTFRDLVNLGLITENQVPD